MIATKMTGILRYRTHSRWWYSQPLVVVQVQIHDTGFGCDESGTYDVDRLYWCDATVGDVTRFKSTLKDKDNG